MKMKMKMLKGAASFYIVAFSTLILVIIATSFATVILSEVARSMNDDLSQSAYDSALAGVEDAKLAYSNYRRCVDAATRNDNTAALHPTGLSGGADITCQDIIYWMNVAEPDCDMVGHILGRLPKYGEGSSGEVTVNDTITTSNGDVTNNLNQAYTCAKIDTKLSDYRATLTSSNQVRVVKVEFENESAANVGSVELGWYTNRGSETFHYNSLSPALGRVAFMPIGAVTASTPPVIELQMVQTAQNFTFEQVTGMTVSGRTDRATMYFVPTNDCAMARNESAATYTGLEKGTCVGTSTNNSLSASQVAATNDQAIKKKPFGVWCPENGTGEFMCAVKIQLPDPLPDSTNGTTARNNDTFMFMVTLPYEQPDTDFSLKFYDRSGNPVVLKGAQVEIDSTGRANDLFRRVEARLESSDVSFPYTYYAMELLGGRTDMVLEKSMTVTSEYNNYR